MSMPATVTRETPEQRQARLREKWAEEQRVVDETKALMALPPEWFWFEHAMNETIAAGLATKAMSAAYRQAHGPRTTLAKQNLFAVLISAVTEFESKARESWETWAKRQRA